MHAPLVARGHTLHGMTRNPTHRSFLTELGARPVVADVLDVDMLLASVADVCADALVHELTALPKGSHTCSSRS